MFDYWQPLDLLEHTGLVESFHGLTLVYTPKQLFFWPPMFTTRKRMAVIDFNSNHGQRQDLTDREGRTRLEMVYSRARGQMKPRRVVAAKSHPYVARLLSDMLERRRAGPVLGQRPLAEDDPRRRFVHRGAAQPTPEEAEDMRLEWQRHQQRRTI
ncbi:uncharacterized protein LOC122380905 [Amphibalanus amphitrite]|uniref:uncharacterized protein LOC122380905 n=1 Tax=Amphibalanus amphitrite TaxID=1232801 RepID=UPI001C91EF55|nr:uncharacterized protein LOC122380905 [Amphibalanus amphitrite]